MRRDVLQIHFITLQALYPAVLTLLIYVRLDYISNSSEPTSARVSFIVFATQLLVVTPYNYSYAIRCLGTVLASQPSPFSLVYAFDISLYQRPIHFRVTRTESTCVCSVLIKIAVDSTIIWINTCRKFIYVC